MKLVLMGGAMSVLIEVSEKLYRNLLRSLQGSFCVFVHREGTILHRIVRCGNQLIPFISPAFTKITIICIT